MIFEPETCLYVSSITKPQIHEKKFLIFSKWWIFSNSLLFLAKQRFLKISADFVTGLQKLFFHLKALQTRMQMDVIHSFVAQVVPEIYAKNTYLKNRQMRIFVTNCRFLFLQVSVKRSVINSAVCCGIQPSRNARGKIIIE